MDRQRLNRIGGVVPILLSLMALGVVAIAVTTGWERGLADEGVGAHLFQLLIVAQVPFILLFLGTANWRSGLKAAAPLAVQATALGLAMGSVALFHL